MTDQQPSAPSEFSLIETYFSRPVKKAILGVGDDCALIRHTAQEEIAISTDMLISGRHFFADVDPEALGHKCLAVNLSDLAAMGAKPQSFTLALALPESNAQWLAAFSKGLFELADAYECELIGGDTTRGPLAISITILGSLPQGQAIRRSGAQVGDDIWVSGTLGNARLALGHFLKEWHLDATTLDATRINLEQPTPRVELGMALRNIANSAIDISDGLAGDLQHILDLSKVGARIDLTKLPLSPQLRAQSYDKQVLCALTGGDDYELCFSSSPANRETVLDLGSQLDIALHRVGTITETRGLVYADAQNHEQALPSSLTRLSFDHFAL